LIGVGITDQVDAIALMEGARWVHGQQSKEAEAQTN
jgi:hypothetical protein